MVIVTKIVNFFYNFPLGSCSLRFVGLWDLTNFALGPSGIEIEIEIGRFCSAIVIRCPAHTDVQRREVKTFQMYLSATFSQKGEIEMAARSCG